jgi:hypothetical protein
VVIIVRFLSGEAFSVLTSDKAEAFRVARKALVAQKGDHTIGSLATFEVRSPKVGDRH